MSKQKPEKKSGSFGSSLFGRLFGRKRELSIFEEEQIQSPVPHDCAQFPFQ